MPKSLLILFAHPAFEKSRVHRTLVAAVREQRGVTVHDLYDAYPDHDIDVMHEQTLLTSHDVVVFQHPLYWYSVPPLLKQWMDLVLEHGWAYGSTGRALEGKVLQVATTAGGGASAYGPDGINRFTFEEFLRPIEATARLCRMSYRAPWVRAGTHAMSEADIAVAARDYIALIERLQAER